MANAGRALTASEVAARLQVTPGTVRRWVRGGHLRGALAGGRGPVYRIADEEVERFQAAEPARTKRISHADEPEEPLSPAEEAMIAESWADYHCDDYLTHDELRARLVGQLALPCKVRAEHYLLTPPGLGYECAKGAALAHGRRADGADLAARARTPAPCMIMPSDPLG